MTRSSLLPAACTLLLLGGSAWAQGGVGLKPQTPQPAEKAPERGPEPEPQIEPARRSGLGAAFHAGRRATLAAKLQTGVVLVRGLPPTRAYVPFRQDKSFWYLTGVESPDAALLIDIDAGKQVLFLPGPNARLERWEGEIWDAADGWIQEVTGFADVRAIDELGAALAEHVRAKKLVWVSKTPHVTLSGCWDRAAPFDARQAQDPFDGRASREEALEDALRERYEVEVRDCSSVLEDMRRVKTPEEIAALRRAGEVAALAMTEAIRSTRPGLLESELESLMTWLHRRAGASGPAYHAIVGSGPNALVLHYAENSRRLRAGEMVLIDYAAEVDHYTSDVTRSWPSDGHFTPRMAELYDVVFAAQAAGIAAVEPGATLRDVDQACRRVLARQGMLELLPHGSCHYIGLEVHDVGSYTKPLEPGVCFTIEPGVYDRESGIGIRIEDVVVVTEYGCEVLTDGVPKARSTISELVRSSGLLDREFPPPAAGGGPEPARKR